LFSFSGSVPTNNTQSDGNGKVKKSEIITNEEKNLLIGFEWNAQGKEMRKKKQSSHFFFYLI
jgi:hypothetical protein